MSHNKWIAKYTADRKSYLKPQSNNGAQIAVSVIPAYNKVIIITEDSYAPFDCYIDWSQTPPVYVIKGESDGNSKEDDTSPEE